MEAALSNQTKFTASTILMEPASILVLSAEQGYRRQFADRLIARVGSWSVTDSCAQALLDRVNGIADFDVFLVDANALDVDPAGLLRAVRDRCPTGIRVLLAGSGSAPPVIETMNCAHQVLSREKPGEELIRALARALSLRGMLAAEEMEAAIGRIDLLPMLPNVYLEFVRAAQTEGVELGVLAGIIEQDVSLSAKVLQLVNSAFFGLRSKVTRLEHAVSVLGIEMVGSLVTSTTAFSTLTDRANVRLAESIWVHSRQVGDLAERFMANNPDDSLHAEIVQASLLHDIGRLVIQHSMPRSAQIINDLVCYAGASVGKAEKSIIGGTHAEIGAYLLSLWGLSERTVRSVLLHHDFEMAARSQCDVTAVVAVANCLVPSDGDYSDEGIARRAEQYRLAEFFGEARVRDWVSQAVALMNE